MWGDEVNPHDEYEDTTEPDWNDYEIRQGYEEDDWITRVSDESDYE